MIGAAARENCLISSKPSRAAWKFPIAEQVEKDEHLILSQISFYTRPFFRSAI